MKDTQFLAHDAPLSKKKNTEMKSYFFFAKNKKINNLKTKINYINYKSCDH